MTKLSGKSGKSSMAIQRLFDINSQLCFSVNASLLGNFLNIVSVMLACSLLQLQRTQTNSFIEAIIECTQMKREAIFAAELTFDENGKTFRVHFVVVYVTASAYFLWQHNRQLHHAPDQRQVSVDDSRFRSECQFDNNRGK